MLRKGRVVPTYLESLSKLENKFIWNLNNKSYYIKFSNLYDNLNKNNIKSTISRTWTILNNNKKILAEFS
jgi:hypothetical protein